MLSRLFTALCALALGLAVSGVATADDDTGVKCDGAGCRATATGKGTAGTTHSPVTTNAATPRTDEPSSDSSAPDPCPWQVVEDLGPNSSWWAGNDPSAGHIELNKCVLGDSSVPGGGQLQLRFVPNGGTAGPVAPPPPTPEQLAQQAISQLVVPPPSIGVGPDRAKLAVKLWTWLWVDNPPPASVTVAAGVSVTATATLTSTWWSLGEPASSGDVYMPGAPVILTCQGAGTPPPAEYDWKTEPPCGHMFAWRSLKERTGGTGTWPVTATTTWTVTWQSNTGVAGADTLTAATADQWDVGEYRTVLVQGPGG